MTINYGPSTKTYIVGLKAELAGLDPKADDFNARKTLIESEIDGANKNLKAEEKAASEADDKAAE